MIEIASLSGLFRHKPISVYQLLRYLPTYLCVDVGAAAGVSAEQIKHAARKSTVICFEPFPGNWTYIDEKASRLPGVEVRRQAVHDTVGTVQFHMPSTVTGVEPGWEGMVGYSSGGYIVDKEKSGKSIEVEAIRLDDQFKQHISFLKIDVQGTELNVLKGANSLLTRGLIDMIYCEYSAQAEIIEYMNDLDYFAFDTDFLAVLDSEVSLDTLPAHLIVGEKRMSNGRNGYTLVFKGLPRIQPDYDEFIHAVAEKTVAFQTDMLFVSRRFLPTFFASVSTHLAK